MQLLVHRGIMRKSIRSRDIGWYATCPRRNESFFLGERNVTKLHAWGILYYQVLESSHDGYTATKEYLQSQGWTMEFTQRGRLV